MIACTSTASASRRKSTSPSTPRLRSSPRTSMLSLTTSSPPRASAVFAREDDAVVSLSLDLCYTTSWDSTPAAVGVWHPFGDFERAAHSTRRHEGQRTFVRRELLARVDV